MQETTAPSRWWSIARRPPVLVHDTADLHRLVIHLFTHWKPAACRDPRRWRRHAGGAARAASHRAPYRGLQLRAGACLAALTLLGGTVSVQWVARDWMVPDAWGTLGALWVLVPLAALLGWTIEVVWTRVKLMLVLRGVRHQLGT